MRIACPVHVTASDYPEITSLVYNQACLSYASLEDTIVRQALAFRRQGILAGNRVAFLSRNGFDLAAAFFSLPRIGASIVPLNLRLHPTDWQSQLAASGAKFLIADEHYRTTLTALPIPVLTAASLVASQGQANSFTAEKTVDDQIDSEQEAAVVSTSGSSGTPKGAILTYGNFIFNAIGSNENIPLRTGDCWLLSLPLYHVGGISILYRCALAGAAVRIAERFDADETAELVHSGAVTHLSLVPTMLRELLNIWQHQPPPPTLKAILLGGAAPLQTLIEHSRSLSLPLLTSYGLTEAASQVCTLSPIDPPDKLPTCGRALKYREVAILVEAGTIAPPNTIGEIAVRGETLSMGYLNEITSPLDSNGWFRTGDVGSLDADGYLSVFGRRDDMFISGGENIFPREIESVAGEFPGVESCAVIAVPDDRWGKRPVLFVERTQGRSFAPELLGQFLQQRLSRIKIPDQIIVLAKLPRTGIGKPDKIKLRELFDGRESDHGADLNS